MFMKKLFFIISIICFLCTSCGTFTVCDNPYEEVFLTPTPSYYVTTVRPYQYYYRPAPPPPKPIYKPTPPPPKPNSPRPKYNPNGRQPFGKR